MSLLATQINSIRMANDFDKNERRWSEFGALDHFIMDTNAQGGIVNPQIVDMARRSMGKVMDFPAIKYDGGNVSIGSSRSLTIADSELTSVIINVTFTTYTFGFTQVPVLFTNNEIGMQQDFEAKLKTYVRKLADTLDLAAISALNTNRTQVVENLLGKYSFAANTLIVTDALKEDILGDIDPLFRAGDLSADRYTVIGDMGLLSIINNISEKGLYQDVFKQKGQLSNRDFKFTNRLTATAGKRAAAFAVINGNCAMLSRFERECLAGTRARTGHEWGIETLPWLGIPVGTYTYESVDDYSAIAGAASADMDRVRKIHYGFAVDQAFVTVYNSLPAERMNPFLKIHINTAATDADTTAPTVDSTSSASLASVTVTFDEPMAIDLAGTLLTGDVADYFDLTVATPGAAISAAVANETGTQVVFTLSPTTNLAADDDISANIPLYDAKGNALADLKVTEVNAGATAWEDPS